MFYVQQEGPLGQYYELRDSGRHSNLSDDPGYGGYNNSVSLHNDPTIEYLTLFPETNDPYGRSFIDSALFHLIMVVDFFKAYKDVLASIVWPNLADDGRSGANSGGGLGPHEAGGDSAESANPLASKHSRI